MTTPYRQPVHLGCPRCRGALEERSAGQLRVLACPTCRGLWLAHEAVTQFLVVTDAELQAIGMTDAGTFRPEPAVLVLPRLCPRCARQMKRERLARAGVTVDVCRAHGMWFDPGELRAFVAALQG